MSELWGFEVKKSQEFGRFVVAKKDFQLGDLILDEEPLLISGFVKGDIDLNCQDFPEYVHVSTFGCVGCFKALSPEENSEVCSKCFWPVCCNSCAQESLHAKYECSLFAERKIGVSDEGYAHIYILRGVLMYQDEVNPTPWGQLASLCSTYDLKDESYLETRLERTQTATKFLRQHFEMNVDPKIVDHIIGAFHVNAFEMTGEDQDGNSYAADALYSLGSMFGHGCAPNGEWVILAYDYNGIRRGHIRIYARRNILSGETINVSYMPDCFTEDTAGRRHYLSTQLYFDCQCSRCLDHTEFFYYTEAITCTSCGDDRLTADNPSDAMSNWTCNHCGVGNDHSFAKMCVERFYNPTLLWNSASPTTFEMSLTLSNEKCGLNKNHRDIILNTFYWIEERSCEQFEELFLPSTGRDENFANFMKLTTKCRKVLGMFGSMADIVDLEMWFAWAIAGYYFKSMDFISIPYDPYLPEEKLIIVTAICAHLKTAYDTVEWSPYNIMYLNLRQKLIDGYKFWNDQLKALKEAPSIQLSDLVNKESPEESELLKEAVELEKMSESQSSDLPSDVITSSGDFNLPLLKPPVSLLTECESSDLLPSDVITSSGDFNLPLLKPLVSLLTEGDSSDLLPSDVVTSSGDCNLPLLKPPVSLLTELDFYFDE